MLEYGRSDVKSKIMICRWFRLVGEKCGRGGALDTWWLPPKLPLPSRQSSSSPRHSSSCSNTLKTWIIDKMDINCIFLHDICIVGSDFQIAFHLFIAFIVFWSVLYFPPVRCIFYPLQYFEAAQLCKGPSGWSKLLWCILNNWQIVRVVAKDNKR